MWLKVAACGEGLVKVVMVTVWAGPLFREIWVRPVLLLLLKLLQEFDMVGSLPVGPLLLFFGSWLFLGFLGFWSGREINLKRA